MSDSARPSLRDVQKAAGRDHVADIAGQLFLEQGYAKTSTKQVAAAAQVAEGTIFNLFGTKASLLMEALRRRVPGELMDLSPVIDQARALEDPGEVIAFFCRHDDQVAAQALGLARVFLEAAAADPVVAQAWREQEEVRFEEQQWLLDVLDRRGWLREDRPRDQLARALWLTVSPEAHLKIADAGVPPESFRAWRATALRALLIQPG